MNRYLLIASFALVLTAGAYAQFAESVLPNGSFEEGLAGWTLSVTDAQGLGAKITEDPAQAKHGARSAQLDLPGGPSTASLASPLTPVEGGKDYLLTFYFRSEGFSDTNLFAGVNLQFTLTWLNGEKKPVPGPGGAGLAYGAVPDWRFMCKLYHAPAEAAFMALSYRMSCDEKGRPSSAWFDRVQLRPWPGGAGEALNTWVYRVSEGTFNRNVYRRVADDDTPTGFAVIANPEFMTNSGYLAGGLYLRTLVPGQYRAIFRLKAGELPAEPQTLLSWDLNTASMGKLNAGTISTADFRQAGVYQDFSVRFVLPPDAQFVDPRVAWSGAVTTSVDTITIVQEKEYTPEDLKALMD